jgi:spermidine synthase
VKSTAPRRAPRREQGSGRAAERAQAQRGRPGGWALGAIAGAFLVSGAAGLMHEVVWSRLLALVFGATSLAISTVLAAYMGGLALGSWWIGTRSEELRDRRRVYAWLEIGIGLGALVVPLLLAAVGPAYGWLWRRFHLSFAAFSVLRLLVATLILLGPTLLMGATLPVLAAYCAGLQGRQVAPPWLYTVNLAGAALGVAAAGFAVMPALGVWGTIIVAALLNIGAGLAVMALPVLPERPAATGREADDPVRLGPLLIAVAFASGLMAMATQVAWTRVLSLIVGSTTYAFSSVLLVYLVALAAGSAWAARRSARLDQAGPDLALMHALFAVGLLGAVWSVNRLPYWYLRLSAGWAPQSLAGVVAVQMTILCSVLLVPVLCAGTILPLVLGAAAPAGARGTGPAVARVYAVNTLGAIAGALGSGFVLVPFAGTQATLIAVCGLAAVLAVACAWWGEARWAKLTSVATLVLVGAGALWRPAWNYLELHSGVYEPGRIHDVTDTLTSPGEKALYQREGPTASVLVALRPGEHGDIRSLLINARVNASDYREDMQTQLMLAHAPLLLTPRPRDVFLIGWGSGVTAGAVLAWPDTRLTAVELEPAVVEASREYEHVNGRPLGNPRLRLVEDDARHILLADETTYDVIVSEPSHPWVSGVANLFTADFYRLAGRRLRPDGVFAQWLQAYQISLDSFRAILAAYQSVFPEVLVFILPNNFDTIVVGSRQPLALDLADVERRWAVPEVQADLARIEFRRPEDLLARLYLGPEAVRSLVRGSRLNTDDNMLVETRGPAQMVWGSVKAYEQLLAALSNAATPVDMLLADPRHLRASPERLTALIEALRRTKRPTAYYERLRNASGSG